MDYGDPQIVYASLATGPGTGISKSTDGGVTWTLSAVPELPAGVRISAFTVASGTHGQRLYALAGGPPLAERPPQPCAVSTAQTTAARPGRWGRRKLASAGGKMYADPQRPDVVYIMGTAIYRSTNGGKSVAAFWGAPSGADPASCGSIPPTRNG
jgi:hypothetical protein